MIVTELSSLQKLDDFLVFPFFSVLCEPLFSYNIITSAGLFTAFPMFCI